MVLLELLLVRHGVSCANAWGYTSKALELLYPDPELTRYGIRRSIEKGTILQTYVDRLFPDKKYSIGASCMIRAQQTAYYMLAKDARKPIHILPHIGERMPALCNVPLSTEEQRPLLGADVVAAVGVDARGDVGISGRADWTQFLQWVHTEGSPCFTRTTNVRGEVVLRAVLVTHSLFLQHVFHEFLNNNDLLYAKVDTTTHAILEQRRLTDFRDLTDEKTEVEGCRYPTVASFAQHAGAHVSAGITHVGTRFMNDLGSLGGLLRGLLGRGSQRHAKATRKIRRR